MKFNVPMLLTLLVGYANQIAAKDNQGCELPQGSYQDSCPKFTIEYCDNYKKTNWPCKFAVDCWTDTGTKVHSEIMLPSHTTYLAVASNNGTLSHAALEKLLHEQNTSESIECEPCKLPEGNYINSCYDYSITYITNHEDINKSCLFVADCDVYMTNKRFAVGSYKPKNIHNEILIEKNVLFSNVRNLEGRLIHDSNQLEVVTDACYERGSNEPVAVQSGSATDGGDRLLPKLMVGATLAYTLFN